MQSRIFSKTLVFILAALNTLSLCSKGQQSERSLSQGKVGILAIGPTAPRRFKYLKAEEVNKLIETQQSSSKGSNGALNSKRSKEQLQRDLSKTPMLLPPLPEEIPPRALYYLKGRVNGKPVYGSLRVSFNNPVSFLDRIAGKPFTLSKKPEANAELLHTIPKIDKDSYYLIYLIPQLKNGKANWEKTIRVIQHKITKENFPEKTIKLMNLSDYSITCKVGKTVYKLRPGAKKSVELGDGLIALRAITNQPGGKSQLILNTGFRSSNVRKCYHFYTANPKTNGGRPVACVPISFN